LTRILLVDDEKKFLRILSESLPLFVPEFHVLTAENGMEALKILERKGVDLVVTDLKMPKMDGFEFLAHVRETHPAIPLIAMSSFINAEAEKRLRELGVTQYLEKPLNLEDLVKKILSESSGGSGSGSRTSQRL